MPAPSPCIQLAQAGEHAPHLRAYKSSSPPTQIKPGSAPNSPEAMSSAAWARPAPLLHCATPPARAGPACPAPAAAARPAGCGRPPASPARCRHDAGQIPTRFGRQAMANLAQIPAMCAVVLAAALSAIPGEHPATAARVHGCACGRMRRARPAAAAHARSARSSGSDLMALCDRSTCFSLGTDGKMPRGTICGRN